MPTIHTRTEGKRGCGYRKEGGTYLVSDGPGRPCGRIPFPLERCPTCDHGIKPSRSWTWINMGPILNSLPVCPNVESTQCSRCPLHTIFGRAGLIWIGSKFYATPADFMAEAQKMGLSRRIPAVPKEFVLGETWVLLAHRECIPRPCLEGHVHEAAEEAYTGPDHGREQVAPIEHDGEAPSLDLADPEVTCAHCQLPEKEWLGPGVFYVFQPQRIEYVVKPDDSEEKLDRMEKRGITLIRIERIEDQPVLPVVQGELHV